TTVILGSQESIPQGLLELQNTSDAFIYIAEKVVPTVVTVQSTRLVSSADMERYHNQDDLRDFFRFRIPKEFRQRGSGSGIIVSHEGFILTNVHVVDKSEKLRVILADNREFEAEIVGLDPLTEVAVIKIKADNLPIAKLGDSDQSKVGEWVLAIGNPLELRSTVTAGIISAKERRIDIIRNTFSVESFLQTDAAINPGNSGGALVNLRGEVIGVNTAIATETGYNAGFGFAIPINLAKKIMADLIHKGKVERGFLGIAMLNMDEKKARALSLKRPQGVFIDRVLKGSPAAKAGVKVKDVIIKIENEEVNKSNQVQAIIAKKSPGEVIQLALLRKGHEINLEVTLGLRETTTAEIHNNTKSKKYNELGLSCEDLTREKAAQLSYSGKEGAVVTKVEQWSPADEAGIIEDDIIVEINDHVIKSKSDFQKTFSKLEKGTVAIFTIIRNKEEFHIFVEIPQ
ncbi:MAG: Do family serine endopeptidase, partial [bacterium]